MVEERWGGAGDGAVFVWLGFWGWGEEHGAEAGAGFDGVVCVGDDSGGVLEDVTGEEGPCGLERGPGDEGLDAGDGDGWCAGHEDVDELAEHVPS